MTAPRPAGIDRRRFVATSVASAAVLATGVPMPSGVKNLRPMTALADDGSRNVPMFRGNAARTGVMPGPGPDTSTGVEVIWTFTLKGGTSEPVVVDGMAYVGGEEGLSALNAKDGTERWRFTIEGESFIETPAVVDGVAYIGGTNYLTHAGGFYAVQAVDGTEHWRVALGSATTPPAVVDGSVYVGDFDGELLAFNAKDGTEIWRFTTSNHMVDSPAVVDGVVYVGDRGNLYALNAADGTERWRFFVDAGIFRFTPAVADGVAYVAGRENLYAVNTADGTERWRYTLVGSGTESSPSVMDGVVYVFDGTFSDSHLCAVNVGDGTELWRFSSDNVGYSQMVAGDVVYFGTDDGNLYAVNAADGTELWRLLVEADDSISCAAVVDGLIYVVGLNMLYVIGARVPKLSVGGSARVTENASLRGGPAPTAVERAELMPDTTVTITGESVTAGEVVWWPVTVDQTGAQGWVKASRLEPLSSGPASSETD